MSLTKGLAVQFDVVYALMLRETRAAYGDTLLGYLWALSVPFLWVMTIFIVFLVVGRVVPYGMDTVTFIVTGLLPFLMFRNIANGLIGAVGSNLSLLYFRQVHPVDTYVARGVLEAFTMTVAFWLFIGANSFLNQSFNPHAILGVVTGLMVGALLGVSTGMFLGVCNVFLPAIGRIFGRLSRVLFFTSGIFFSVKELPLDVQEIFLWNPLLHIVSAIRAGWHRSFEHPEVTLLYPLAFCLCFSALALLLQPLAQRRVTL